VNSSELPSFSLRALGEADLDRVVELNNASTPAVPHSTREDIARLVELATLALVVIEDSRPEYAVGFVLAMAPGVDYDSENYTWFADRGVAGMYVDRVVLGEGFRGQGLGPRLYGAVFDAARQAGLGEVQCEVNVDPPNPGSLAFHSRNGFGEVGRQATKGGSVVVALLAASVD
jgi:predicted GNAT superfamily acetyltransferase